MMIDDYDFIASRLKTDIQNGRAEAWAQVLFVMISFTASTLLSIQLELFQLSCGFNGNNVSYALSETPNGCQARMPQCSSLM